MADSALAQLVGAYLNQDLFDTYADVTYADVTYADVTYADVTYADVMAGVDDFVIEALDLARSLPGEIDRVLADLPNDDLQALLTRLGIGFVAGRLTYRGWLTRIADRVRAATA